MNIDLSLEVSKAYNLKTMRLFDTSQYHVDEVVDNYMVEILPVNKKNWVTFNVAKHFQLILNSSNLLYHRITEESKLIELPDGIYEIKQSYKPNIKTLVHFYHLRTTSLRYKYTEALEKHFSNECKKEKRIYELEALLLNKVSQYIEAAEFAVSEKHDKKRGIEFYNQAVDLIKKINDECGCR